MTGAYTTSEMIQGAFYVIHERFLLYLISLREATGVWTFCICFGLHLHIGFVFFAHFSLGDLHDGVIGYTQDGLRWLKRGLGCLSHRLLLPRIRQMARVIRLFCETLSQTKEDKLRLIIARGR